MERSSLPVDRITGKRDTTKLKEAFRYRPKFALEDMPQGAYPHSVVVQVYFRQVLAEEKRVERGRAVGSR